MKIGVVKLGFGLVVGAIVLVLVAIVTAAWVRGGVQPAQMVEIPVDPSSLGSPNLQKGRS